mmetsp:Transcript_47998/g.71526  ORF Transcript_47998/g.71526 Transcript_47998/m.71526 type:complete len:220 (-) Transcript_47998:266-925(-)
MFEEALLFYFVSSLSFYLLSVRNEVLGNVLRRNLSSLKFIGQVLQRILVKKVFQLIGRNHVHLLTKVGCQHRFHNLPNSTKPSGRVDNQKQTDSNRNTSLKHHHELMTVVDTKVGHAPVCHVSKEGDTLCTSLFFFNHDLHAVCKIINNLFDGGLLGKVATGTHIKDVVALLALQTGNDEKCLGQELLFEATRRQFQVVCIVFVHDLPCCLDVKLCFAG